MTAIRNAIQIVYGTTKPAKVAFVVVQKRHHTRFFPTKPEFSDGNNNIPPGTVVNKDIVHPFQYQFFLASHAAIKVFKVYKEKLFCSLIGNFLSTGSHETNKVQHFSEWIKIGSWWSASHNLW